VGDARGLGDAEKQLQIGEFEAHARKTAFV
jgi:hypothetical protein